jgi:cytochrome P450
MSMQSSGIDLFEADALRDPYPHYCALRDRGPAAWLDEHQVWFLGRYAGVRQALGDWRTYTSAKGIGLNPIINDAWSRALICVDPPEHTAMRKLITDRLGPQQVKRVADTIDRRANELVDALLRRGRFDAVKDLAADLPVNVIMDLIGWPKAVREQVLHFAEGAFDCCGPQNPMMMASLPRLQQMMQLIESVYDAGTLTPGGFGATIADAARSGEITRETAVGMLAGYVVAAFDTTISAMSSGVWLFARHPEQWQKLRADPSRIPQACNEILRIESPIQMFSRVATCDVDLGDGVKIPAGGRVIVSYGSANRDERQFAEPDRFDITRNASTHLAFGTGNHACAGQSLARLELHAVFGALTRRVAGFEFDGEAEISAHQMTRSFARVPVRITAVQ